ncbi:helix-turn-helix domain-containing protein, partial [Pseudostreptobacillus hongkongensis]|uniref:helix-turn-helix domain-containing protein n=1 Tax=Pseudostreptobacillus hongkongensis TaxID=1162717 RepID=UPI0012E3EA37
MRVFATFIFLILNIKCNIIIQKTNATFERKIMKKNLDDFERNEILIGLKNFKTFNQIANELNRNRSTISREVFRNRKIIFNKKS